MGKKVGRADGSALGERVGNADGNDVGRGDGNALGDNVDKEDGVAVPICKQTVGKGALKVRANPELQTHALGFVRSTRELAGH